MIPPALPAACDVALPIPNAEPYSYSIPPSLADRVVPGARVVVPVRSRRMVGVVVDYCDDRPDSKLKPVLLAPDSFPLVSESLLELAGWISRYYAAPLGTTLKAMLPGPLWGASRLYAVLRDAPSAPGGVGALVVRQLASRGGRASTATLARALKRPVWDVVQRLARAGVLALEVSPERVGPKPGSVPIIRLTRALPSLMERDEVFGRAKRQREAYETIDALGGEVAVSHLTSELGFSSAILRALVERDLASREEREELRDPFEGVVAAPPASPTPDQLAAIRAIRAEPPGGVATLFGVTGSGKTLVYLEAIRAEVEAGRGAIILVPEIALTPQTIARVRGVFGNAVAVLHSGLSAGERADAWRAVASGVRRVAVGARSAVFAPVPNLSAIVVDEEHDASYKNGEIPRYHARDVARRRARLEGARVVLGSATPSLETWALRDRITVVRLPQRAMSQPLPRVELVDLRSAPQIRESGPVPWSETLDDAVVTSLDSNEQIILLLNRRGFAHLLQCTDCGVSVECPHCTIALTVHETPASLKCHYCGYERTAPQQCDACGGRTQRTRGVGTQSLERWLVHRYPRARLARMDADTTGTKWSHRRILTEFAEGRIDVLFGTQMIAKGLDFPGVTLVGVVNADTGLYLPDFRAAERTFQLVAQVAGRAGRGPAGGRVLVQTRTPQHYALVTASAHDFEGFAARELEVRRDPPYPPHLGLVNIVVSGLVEPAVAQAADEVASWLRGLVQSQSIEASVLGPAPAPLTRLKDRWRWHVMVRAEDRGILGRVLRFAQRRAPHTRQGAIRVIFDRDPVSLL